MILISTSLLVVMVSLSHIGRINIRDGVYSQTLSDLSRVTGLGLGFGMTFGAAIRH